MFKIDLLKGQGIPPRTGPGGLFIILVTAIMPVALAICLYGLYYNSKVVATIKQSDVSKLEADISELSDAVQVKQMLERKKFFYNSCLAEVKTSLEKYKQWSPVLGILLEEMPTSVVLKNLEVKHEMVRKNKPGAVDPLSTQDIMVTKLVLKITNRDEGDYSEQVKDFRNRLYASSELGSKLENIIFSREANQREGMETISYKIECLFKPEI